MSEGVILVVEDDRARRYVAGRILREAGYEILECGTGAEGLRLARERRPDLVLLDVHLPDADGRDVCRRLKADPETAGIAVLHLSAAYASTADAVTGLRSGADGYLTYPVEPAYLAATVLAFVRARRAERRVEEHMRSLNETLERRVAERTAELVAHRQQLRALVAQLGRTEQRERHRVAADLHDHLAQLLAVCKMKASAIAPAAPPAGDLAGGAAELKEMLGQAIDYTRSLMSDLSPTALDRDDIDAAMQWAVHRAEKQGLEVQFVTDGRPKPLDDDVHALLLQGARELLLNVAKHSGSKRATLAVERVGDAARVTVTDSGAGLDPAAWPPVPTATGGFGLFNLRERLHLLGGAMEIESSPSRGTTVRLTAPLQPAPPP